MLSNYQQILVAVDGSNQAEWAFKKAIAIALRNEATLHIVSVIDNRSYSAAQTYNHLFEEETRKSVEELLVSYKEEAEAKGVQKVDTILTVGSPKRIISREIAEDVNADLIICGATGLNAIERFIIGSVSEHILRTSPCDVLIVRSKEDAEANA